MAILHANVNYDCTSVYHCTSVTSCGTSNEQSTVFDCTVQTYLCLVVASLTIFVVVLFSCSVSSVDNYNIAVIRYKTS